MTQAVSLLALVSSLLANGTAPELHGTVQDAKGTAVAGARVSIATAAPRTGPGLFCPSCYSDCGKWTRTNERGEFTIRGLAATLKFTVLVTAPGKKGQKSPFLDPLVDEAKIVLEALPPQVPGERTILARIVNDRGEPIPGALIEARGARFGEVEWMGGVKVIDPTVSDGDGNFSATVPVEFQRPVRPGKVRISAVNFSVTAPGYSGTLVTLKPGPEPQRIVVPSGTRVVGTIVQGGKPVAGARVAVVQMNRRMGHHFIKAVGAMSDANGKFVIDNLPAEEDYTIFSPVGAGPQQRVLTTKKFHAYADRTERDLGELEAIEPLRLAGKVEVPKGEKLPANVKVTLGRPNAWDLIAEPVKADGSFVIQGLPPETYGVRVAAPGFVVDGARMPYQRMQVGGYGLRLRESIADLRIPLIKGNEPD